MRTHKSIRNSCIAFLANALIIIIGFISQKIFVTYLGAEYLGINGLFTNIISMLSITELGLSTAIIYSLYKPISKKDIIKIKSLMNFYKKSYNVVSLIILILGLLLIPFLKVVITSTPITLEIIIIYILFVLDSFFSYFISYKRSILIADQENYIVNTIHILQLILLNIIQIIVLILTKNYYLYLILKIVFKLLENIVIIIIVNIKYPYLKDNKEKISLEDKNNIFKNIKALFFHKIGGFIVLGTDNILISKFFGLISVGIYSNYYMITHAITVLFNQIFISITSSIGNLIVDSNYEKNYDVYKKVRFLNVWLDIFASTSILVIINSFIKIWLGDNYLFTLSIISAITINFYLQSLRVSLSIFKEAAGIFYRDRYIPLIEASVNIVCSIIFAKLFGITGIFIGTICSNLVLHLYGYPKYVYKDLFNKSYKKYYIDFINSFIIFIICLLSTLFMSKIIILNNIYLDFIKNVILSILIPNFILFILYHNKKEFKYFKTLINNIFKNLTKN